MIDRFLAEPDKLAVNPHYRSGPPRKLYLQSRVDEIEASDVFKIAKRRAAPRKAAAKKAVATKARDTERYVERLIVVVPRIADADLAERACNHYNFRAAPRSDEDYFRPATPQSDGRFLERITVNYLRHRLTQYESHLTDVAGKVASAAAKAAIKAKVLDAIAVAYPRLADECGRQKNAAATTS